MLIFSHWRCSVTFTFWHGEHKRDISKSLLAKRIFKLVKEMQHVEILVAIIVCSKTFVNIPALNKYTLNSHRDRTSSLQSLWACTCKEVWSFDVFLLPLYSVFSFRVEEKNYSEMKGEGKGSPETGRWRTVILPLSPPGEKNHCF